MQDYQKMKPFSHSKFLNGIKYALLQTSEPLIQHYKKKYDPVYPPSWMLMEIMTCGTLSLMIQNLKPSAEKIEIYKSYNSTRKLLTSGLHCFSYIRNKCAHHSRLIFSKIRFAPYMPKKGPYKFLEEAPLVDNTKLYAALCCMQYMLNICNTDSLFKHNLLSLTQKFPHVNLTSLGFTPNWKNEPLWTP